MPERQSNDITSQHNSTTVFTFYLNVFGQSDFLSGYSGQFFFADEGKKAEGRERQKKYRRARIHGAEKLHRPQKIHQIKIEHMNEPHLLIKFFMVSWPRMEEK